MWLPGVSLRSPPPRAVCVRLHADREITYLHREIDRGQHEITRIHADDGRFPDEGEKLAELEPEPAPEPESQKLRSEHPFEQGNGVFPAFDSLARDAHCEYRVVVPVRVEAITDEHHVFE